MSTSLGNLRRRRITKRISTSASAAPARAKWVIPPNADVSPPVGSTGGRDYDQEELFLGEEFDRQPTEGAKTELLQRAVDVFPDLERAELVQQLAGSRPLSPDRMPIIGPVPGWQGIMLATGHTTKGIHLGPITGKLIAETIIEGSSQIDIDLSSFLPDRFAGLRNADFYASGQRVDE